MRSLAIHGPACERRASRVKVPHGFGRAAARNEFGIVFDQLDAEAGKSLAPFFALAAGEAVRPFGQNESAISSSVRQFRT